MKLFLLIFLFPFTAFAQVVNSIKGTSAKVEIKPGEDVFDHYRAKWVDILTGGNLIDMKDAIIAAKVNLIVSIAKNDWSKLNKEGGRTSIWSDIQDSTKEGNVTTAYRRLANMALAYRINGSALKGNLNLRDDIVSATEWQYLNRYNESSKQFGNWYIWEIGAPEEQNNLLMLMYDDCNPAKLAKYVNAENVQAKSPLRIKEYGGAIGSPCTGGNLSHKAIHFMNQAVLLKDLPAYKFARNALRNVYNDWVPADEIEGDGFHIDGSFIQHYSILYNGGYEAALYRGTCRIMTVIKGTTLDFDTNFKTNAYDKILKTFVPLIYKGQTMDLARGRFVISATGHSMGKIMIECLAKLSQSAPDSIAVQYKGLIKYYIQSNTYYNFFNNCDLESYLVAKQVINDRSIKPIANYSNLNIFSYGAKAALIKPGFGFGINMSSKYASPYESINGENLKGWYTGFGMTYVYNADLGYYADKFWPAINPYRLPGTTVTTEKRDDAAYGWRFKNSQAWVGGTKLNGIYGSIGMSLEGYPGKDNAPLSAKKSWFIFDDEVVALGTDISVGTNTRVETIIENRKLTDANTNVIIVNGIVKSPSLTSKETTLPGVSSLHISGNTNGADMGYYLPQPGELKYLRETRVGSNRSIDAGGSKESITKHFVTFWFDHGIMPANTSYQYVLLPNKTNAQTIQYATNPDIQVLENSAEAQAVIEKKLNIIGINFWNDTIKKTGGISSNKKAAVLVKRLSGRMEIAVSDPTMENPGWIMIEVDQPAESMISADSRIEVIQLKPTLKFNVNVKNAMGKSMEASFQIKKLLAP